MRKIALFFLSAWFMAWSNPADSILPRIAVHSSPMTEVMNLSWNNPALKLHYNTVPLGTISAGFEGSSSKGTPTPQYGDGSALYNLTANGFIPSGNYAVWGNAGYTSGKTYNIKWYETSDPQLLYPYITADEIGGDMTDELYNFSGGYAGKINRFSIGATLGYKAAHHFRAVDPRPRNITGTLTISAGGGYYVSSKYVIGISALWQHYKQSSDITFFNETADVPLYQLTGMGTHYNRFAGASKSSVFTGNRVGITANLFPLSNGFYLNAELCRFTFTKILTDLNKLPLASVWENTITVQGGYTKKGTRLDFSVNGELSASRRHGTENIFGDATSGSYPLIGSLEMYADNRFSCGVNGLLTLHHGSASHSVSVSSHYFHRNELYAEPWINQIEDGFLTSLKMQSHALLGRKWFGKAAVIGGVNRPYSGRIELSAVRSLTARYALGVNLSGEMARYANHCKEYFYNINLNFYF